MGVISLKKMIKKSILEMFGEVSDYRYSVKIMIKRRVVL